MWRDQSIVVRFWIGMALGLFVLAVALNLNGSSAAVLDKRFGVLPPQTTFFWQAKPYLLLGAPRDIRGDEFFLSTPLAMAQTQAAPSFPVLNPNLFSPPGRDMLVGILAPARHPLEMVLPWNWGYFVFDAERAFSFYWYSRLLLLGLSSYFFVFLLTRHRGIAVGGAFWIAFSPYLQWWYSTNFPDLVLCFQAIAGGMTLAITHAKIAVRIAAQAVTFAATTAFAVSLMPSLQVPLGYLLLALFVALLVRERKRFAPRPIETATFATGLVVSSWLIVDFWHTCSPALRVMAGTVHPGKRVSLGGGLGAAFFFKYLTQWKFPFRGPGALNACELSGLLHFLPVVAIALAMRARYRHALAVEAWPRVVAAFLVFFALWLAVPFPEWFAKVTLFSYVPANRLQPLFDLLGVYLTLWFLARPPPPAEEATARRGTLRVVFAIVALHLLVIRFTFLQGMLTILDTIGILAFLGLMSAFLFLHRWKAFLVGALFYHAVAGMLVNPVQRGLNPFFQNPFAAKIAELKSQTPEGAWLALETREAGSLLVALGCRVLGTFQWYPDLAFWRQLDPTGVFYAVYNRFGFPIGHLTDGPTRFEAGGAADFFHVYFRSEDLARLQVRYVFSGTPIDRPHRYRLQLVEQHAPYALYARAVSVADKHSTIQVRASRRGPSP